MSGIGIILNPHSRANLKKPGRADRLGFIVGDKGSCHATHSVEDIERLAHEFKDRGVEILGISGGDGTNHVTLTAFIKAYAGEPLPQIALLRGGTMNNLAGTIGIKGSPEKILSNLIIAYHENKPFQTVEVSMLKVNDIYGFLFGVGGVSRFVDEYNNADAKPSPLRAAAMGVRLALSSLFHTRYSTTILERFDACITLNGALAPFKNYVTVFAGTLETIGFNFRPLYRARANLDKFHVLGMSATPRHVLSRLPRFLFSMPPKSDYFYDDVGRELHIELSRPMPWQIDGDPQAETNRFEITMGPRLTCIVS